MEKSITKKDLREFGFLLGIFFPILLGWIIPAINGHVFRSWTLFIAFPLILIASLKPNLLSYPYKLWMNLGYILGFINSKIILGIVFLFVLIPIAMFMKLFRYDPLRKNKKKETFKEFKYEHKIDLTRIF